MISIEVPAVVTLDELDMLLEKAGRRGFLWHLFRADRHGPEVLAGVLTWPGGAVFAPVRSSGGTATVQSGRCGPC